MEGKRGGGEWSGGEKKRQREDTGRGSVGGTNESKNKWEKHLCHQKDTSRRLLCPCSRWKTPQSQHAGVSARAVQSVEKVCRYRICGIQGV
jgi:hypothetical protein